MKAHIRAFKWEPFDKRVIDRVTGVDLCQRHGGARTPCQDNAEVREAACNARLSDPSPLTDGLDTNSWRLGQAAGKVADGDLHELVPLSNHQKCGISGGNPSAFTEPLDRGRDEPSG